MRKNAEYGSNYLTSVLDVSDGFKDIRELFERVVLKQPDRPNLLVGTGLSGTIATALIGHHFNIPIALLRKHGESTHGQPAEMSDVAYPADVRWVWIDDFISSGTTYRTVRASMRGLERDDAFIMAPPLRNPRFLGAFMYSPMAPKHFYSPHDLEKYELSIAEKPYSSEDTGKYEQRYTD